MVRSPAAGLSHGCSHRDIYASVVVDDDDDDALVRPLKSPVELLAPPGTHRVSLRFFSSSRHRL